MWHPTTTRRPARRHLGFEALEDRELLAFIGFETAVNVKLPNNQFDAATASSYSGRSVIAWTDVKAGADTDIRVRLYDAAGNPVGGDIIVNNTNFIDSAPAVAMDTVGEFVVAWTRTLPSGDRNVQVARFSAAGVNLGGFNSSITVAGSARPEYDPAVAVNRIGDFVVSYTVDTTSSNQDILARMYKDTGAFLANIPVATSPALRETHSSVARILDGRFSIAYQTDAVGVSSNVLLRRYSPVGGLIGINGIAVTPDTEQLPSVSMDEAGNGVVAYQRRSLLTGFDIRAKRFTSAGAVSPEINVRTTLANETAPSVALQHFGGRFVVAYNEGISVVRVSEVSAANVVTTLGALVQRTRPSISIDAQSVYQVAYETVLPSTDGSGSGIRRRRGLL
jgi:hypothetical protein